VRWGISEPLPQAPQHQHSNVKNALAFAVLLFASVTGCGDGKIARYPVSGIVKVDGQPAAGATVIFCPVNADAEIMKHRPFSQTDSSGRYELKTLEPGDGAPAAEYKVTIRWLSEPPQGADADRGGGRSVDRLGNRYWIPETTPLTAKVAAGKNDLPFDLSTKGK
jgi:hypothetical protein